MAHGVQPADEGAGSVKIVGATGDVTGVASKAGVAKISGVAAGAGAVAV